MKGILVAVTLLAAACATPAAANYFSNPMTNTTLNVGSAPSPTPEQLRLIGDEGISHRNFCFA